MHTIWLLRIHQAQTDYTKHILTVPLTGELVIAEMEMSLG